MKSPKEDNNAVASLVTKEESELLNLLYETNSPTAPPVESPVTKRMLRGRIRRYL